MALYPLENPLYTIGIKILIMMVNMIVAKTGSPPGQLDAWSIIDLWWPIYLLKKNTQIGSLNQINIVYKVTSILTYSRQTNKMIQWYREKCVIENICKMK